MALHPIRNIVAGQAPVGGAGFNSLAAGNKQYGTGSNAPNRGPVSAEGQFGYKKRSQENEARRKVLNNMARKGS